MNLKTRVALSLVLMIGFYALALGIAGGLLFIIYAQIAWSDTIYIKLLVVCGITALAILWSILPRFDKFIAPGPRLTEQQQPELFKLIRDVSQGAAQEMPAEVYLIPEVNAWVMHRGGVMGLGSRRVMGIGLALMQSVTLSQLRAILGHEFGHYAGGDTKLGAWIYKTRSAMGRTIENLSDGILHKPFLLYGNMFMRVTQAISRAQEIAADKLAARIAGKRNAIDALVAVHGAGAAYGSYWDSEILPVLSNGYRPPIAAGFAKFLGVSEIADQVKKIVDGQLQEAQADEYDSHPPLKERIEALSELPDDAPAAREPLASTLLRNLDTLEAELLQHLSADPAAASALVPVQWEEAGPKVFLPIWRERATEHAAALSEFTAADLARVAETMPAFAMRLRLGTIRPDEREQVATVTVGAALATRLHDDGWVCDATPGRPVSFTKNGRTIEPFSIVPKIGTGELSADAWLEECRVAGIDTLKLV